MNGVKNVWKERTLIKSKLKIIYLSANMKFYTAALYQQDVMDELTCQAEIFVYGPGFPLYDQNDDIAEIILKSGIKPDIIMVGHAWLMDTDGYPVDPHPNLALQKISLPKIGIINKEYTNLESKLAFFKNNCFDLVFSHHHKTDDYSSKTGIKFIFWPFGVNHKVFDLIEKERRIYDIAFSGILQNMSKGAGQSDIRVKIQSEIFHSVLDIPLLKKKHYQSYDIFWNALPRRKLMIKVARVMHKYKHLSIEKYSALHRQSKIFINTLSPVGLISTRVYEVMTSGCLLMTEKSDLYSMIFKDQCYVQFSPDLSDFREKIKYYLSNEDIRNEITKRAYNEVMTHHTWEKRVRDLIQVIQDSF